MSSWSDLDLLEAKERCINDERFEDAQLIDSILQKRLYHE